MSGIQYLTSGKLNAFDQLTIARKLSPAFPIVDGIIRKENSGKNMNILVVMALGMLSDESSKIVIDKCLSVVTRVEPGQPPARITVNGNLMFTDIELDDILKLTAQVIEENLGNFLTTALLSMEADQ